MIPNESDAWLLAALAYTEPSDVIAAADHIYCAIPMMSEWQHACAVLGERGLIEPTASLPRLTPLGAQILEDVRKRERYPRRWPPLIVAEITALSVISSAIEPPDPDLLDKAHQAYSEMVRAFIENKEQEER